MSIDRDTEELLEHWGMWVVQGSGVAGCAVLGDRPTPMITDDEALIIDRLVGRLGMRYAEAAEVILRYYTSGAPFAVVGRRMGFGEEKTRQLWKAGVAWIDGALESRRLAAA
ncbi:antiterminator Q family protein [Stutzerimonas balearica]|uniref:antiterminator Q family protein n=1 Tax=Stutzerimonas balearica TaxID=74829 RepID=UPI0028A90CD4|nr:antiterminator Q family protein [Stutzerimonas balearica]